MTTEILAATVDMAAARLIEEGKQRRVWGRVLDEHTIRRILTEELEKSLLFTEARK